MIYQFVCLIIFKKCTFPLLPSSPDPSPGLQLGLRTSLWRLKPFPGNTGCIPKTLSNPCKQHSCLGKWKKKSHKKEWSNLSFLSKNKRKHKTTKLLQTIAGDSDPGSGPQEGFITVGQRNLYRCWVGGWAEVSPPSATLTSAAVHSSCWPLNCRAACLQEAPSLNFSVYLQCWKETRAKLVHWSLWSLQAVHSLARPLAIPWFPESRKLKTLVVLHGSDGGSRGPNGSRS